MAVAEHNRSTSKRFGLSVSKAGGLNLKGLSSRDLQQLGTFIKHDSPCSRVNYNSLCSFESARRASFQSASGRRTWSLLPRHESTHLSLRKASAMRRRTSRRRTTHSFPQNPS